MTLSHATTIPGQKFSNCPCNNLCQNSIMVYKGTCNVAGKFYVRCKQQKLETRMTQHFSKTVRLASKGLSLDSFVKHFALQAIKERNTTEKDIKDRTSLDILWHGNPIFSSRSFGKLNCSLCMKEGLAILRLLKSQPKRLINSSNELYGACRHQPVFHKYTS